MTREKRVSGEWSAHVVYTCMERDEVCGWWNWWAFDEDGVLLHFGVGYSSEPLAEGVMWQCLGVYPVVAGKGVE